MHGYKPYTTAVIFDRRHGDCKDKSLLLNVMLREIGIDAYPVLIRSSALRSTDDLSLPLIRHFNHCISYLPPTGDRPGMFLDGTATYHPADTVPSSDQGARVLVVKGGASELQSIALTSAQDNGRATETEIALDEDGNARVTLVDRPARNQAVRLRATLGNEPAKRTEKIERRLAPNFGAIQVDDIQCSDLLDMAEPVEVRVDFRAQQFAKRQEDGLVLRAALEDSAMMRLARSTTRVQALLLGIPNSEATTLRYRLPAGYEPVELPPPTDLQTRFGSFRMEWSFDSGELRIERSRSFTTDRIEPSEYPEFREFAIAVDQADRQVVVVAKREER